MPPLPLGRRPGGAACEGISDELRPCGSARFSPVWQQRPWRIKRLFPIRCFRTRTHHPDSPMCYIEAYVTGYNTVVGQTDDTPCIGALGTNICGRRNVVACPPMLQLGTMVEINGKTYICEDRTAPKVRDRFDINCDQDKSCPYQVAGWANIKLLLD